jgi:hypothetical protein
MAPKRGHVDSFGTGYGRSFSIEKSLLSFLVVVNVFLFLIVLADANFPTSSVCTSGPEEIRADGKDQFCIPVIPRMLYFTMLYFPMHYTMTQGYHTPYNDDFIISYSTTHVIAKSCHTVVIIPCHTTIHK